jgi:fumarate hydratase class II
MPLIEATDHFEAQGAQDVLVEVSGACRVVAVSLNKIANDLRWMASGPNTGLGEIRLPALQPGSSIMPGKVNPVIPEVVCQVVAQVIGNDAAVAWAGANGHFELNAMLPVLAKNLLETTSLLTSASSLLAERCIAGITAERERMLDNARRSPAIVTALNPIVGYERAAAFVKESEARGISVAEVIIEHDVLPPDELARVLDVLSLTRPPT